MAVHPHNHEGVQVVANSGVLWHRVQILDECAIPLPTEPLPSPPEGHDYRRLARQIRDLAHQTRLPVARAELLRLATNYDRRGDHLDGRTCF